jgi:hypothetical protein
MATKLELEQQIAWHERTIARQQEEARVAQRAQADFKAGAAFAIKAMLDALTNRSYWGS